MAQNFFEIDVFISSQSEAFVGSLLNACNDALLRNYIKEAIQRSFAPHLSMFL